jgi:hypothetical protein
MWKVRDFGVLKKKKKREECKQMPERRSPAPIQPGVV